MQITREERDRILQVSSSGYNNVDKFKIILKELGIEVEPESLIEGLSTVPWEISHDLAYKHWDICTNGVIIGRMSTKTDALLAAAAPDLYAAVERHRKWMEKNLHFIYPDSINEALRDAIAKAERKDGA